MLCHKVERHSKLYYLMFYSSFVIQINGIFQKPRTSLQLSGSDIFLIQAKIMISMRKCI